MGKRRGHGEGSIYQRESDGLWVGSIDLGYVDGKRKRKTLYGKTRREVSEKLTRALRDQQQGIPVAVERQTVAQYLMRWLDESVKPSTRPKTYRFYEQMIRLYLIPSLGRFQLSKLGPQDVQAMMNHRLADGLSPRTVHHCRAVLRKALNQAVRWNLVPRNVAMLVDPPKIPNTDRRYLTIPEAKTFLDIVTGHRLEALFTVALALGLRQGEALGLRWEDVDLDRGTISVRYALQRVEGNLTLVEPKSQRSRRTLHIPNVALRRLKEHRVRQLEERVAAGPDWQDRGLVFTTQTGTPLDARNMVRQFHKLRDAAGLPWLRFHDLRHGFGSLLAAQGVHPRTAMELMGHSQISLTMEIYSHVAPELARDAATRIDAVLGAG